MLTNAQMESVCGTRLSSGMRGTWEPGGRGSLILLMPVLKCTVLTNKSLNPLEMRYSQQSSGNGIVA